jgi:hypothetical protein
VVEADGSTSVDGARVFDVLWANVAEVLGVAATATLVRRASKRAALRAPELADLTITREGLDYRYAVPASWRDAAAVPPGFVELYRELCVLLENLTGPVMIRKLSAIPELAVPERAPSTEGTAS